ncbi:MAG TPA: flagellin [Terracidiphilus sp.]|jgi:flagellin
MALGVLNNLSAIYAENNLNNTSNSLQKVLQQLSSGSRINSGADDAAGLSLVNGLAANSKALAQSSTNATEGVGLLQVADGALSQVTNLLNRAITLATEASNGTLNTSQGSAANQEYQSILAEINNIGSTTTYNQQAVFNGNTVAIYTGDASPTGSSIDNLYIRTLSAASVGDTGGAMSYSSGQNNVFIDLSSGGKNASVSDSLNGGSTGSTTITVNYLAKGTNGTSSNATANITVGAGSNYANTAQGLISAINNSGLGLSATFATAAQAGSVAVAAALAGNVLGGSASDTGIEISGIGIGTGTNGAGEIGTLTVGSPADTLGGTLTVVSADGKSHNILLGTANSTDTLANLAATINAAGYGVTASLNVAAVGINPPGTVLTLGSDSAAVTVSGTNVTDTPGTSSSAVLSGPITLPAASPAGTLGILTVDNRFDTLSGTLSLTGINGTALGAITLGTANATDTLANLANYINKTANVPAASGLHASVDSTGTILTIATTGPVAALQTAAISTTATAVHSAQPTLLTRVPTVDNAPFSAVIGTLTATVPGANLTGQLTIGHNIITLGTAGATQTMAQLLTTINGGNYGVTATYDSTSGVMTFASPNSVITFSGASLVDTGGTLTLAPAAASNSGYYSVGITGSIQDGSTNGGTTNTGIVADTNGTGSIATVSYTDGAGANLSATDLSTQVHAQAALTQLNQAITDVAAMDGYIGAQINTLNSVSQVLNTQQENVTAAQNAIQATDYAAATSAMSKYEILSQTGIAALAQANSVQQEVTKLLQ